MERRETRTSWKELLKAFISSDTELEKQESEEEIEFNREYSSILSEARKDINSLEAMLEHPDIKLRSKKRQVRKQDRLRTKGQVIKDSSQKTIEDDKEIER